MNDDTAGRNCVTLKYVLFWASIYCDQQLMYGWCFNTGIAQQYITVLTYGATDLKGRQTIVPCNPPDSKIL